MCIRDSAYTNMSEQMAKILRMGANDQSVIDRLNWMRDVQGPMPVSYTNLLMIGKGVHFLQGYLYSPPVPGNKFISEWVMKAGG